MSESSGLILHIVVVGFHHKKGCQVEFSYPSLVSDAPHECPPGWKYLPTLALPDGSHNYLEDSVFFNLPSLEQRDHTVFGVSCYRQIPVEKLRNRPADVTRSTVQKSVCVLSTVPLYGHIEVKLSLIAHAYFEQGDFARTDLLVDAYRNLNQCITPSMSPSQMLVGLSARDIIIRWRHKALLLFKLMLLEKRVVFFGSPVRPLCLTLLGVLSLHPEVIQKGLEQAASVRPSRPMSPMPDFDATTTMSNKINTASDIEQIDPLDNTQIVGVTEIHDQTSRKNEIFNYETELCSPNMDRKSGKELLREASIDALPGPTQCLLTPAQLGAPLPLFINGYLCLPYLSLPYLELLSDPSVRGYVIGASNVLFRQKRHIADVLVDVDNGTIESQDMELRKQLTLSTEDLRFADFLVRYTCAPQRSGNGSDNKTTSNNTKEIPTSNVINETINSSNKTKDSGGAHTPNSNGSTVSNGATVGNIGGEAWIRDQLYVYMLALLRTSLLPEGSRENEHFNGSFMTSWKQTQSYAMWFEKGIGLSELEATISIGHPCSGQLSVADMKLKLSQTMQNSESGRKLNQAVSNTSRAVGGALSQAKGALTNWWSSLTTAQNPGAENLNSDSSVGVADEAIEYQDARCSEAGVRSAIGVRLATGVRSEAEPYSESGARSETVMRSERGVISGAGVRSETFAHLETGALTEINSKLINKKSNNVINNASVNNDAMCVNKTTVTGSVKNNLSIKSDGLENINKCSLAENADEVGTIKANRKRGEIYTI